MLRNKTQAVIIRLSKILWCWQPRIFAKNSSLRQDNVSVYYLLLHMRGRVGGRAVGGGHVSPQLGRDRNVLCLLCLYVNFILSLSPYLAWLVGTQRHSVTFTPVSSRSSLGFGVSPIHDPTAFGGKGIWVMDG